MPVLKLLNPDPRISTVYIIADESASFPSTYLPSSECFCMALINYALGFI